MPDRPWQDMIVRDRMQVDQEFADRVNQSRFSRQQWSLIMTAVDLRIEGSGESARLVADTSKVGDIMPELEKIKDQGGMMGDSGSGGGVFDSIKSSLGIGGGVDRGKLDDATTLADEYAETLQSHLEESGKWELVLDRSEGAD